MSNLEKKVDALMRLVASEDGPSYEDAKAELLQLMTEEPAKNDTSLTTVIEDMLTKLGMPNAIMGFRYAVEAIRLAAEDEDYVFNITKGLYPAVAKLCGTTPSRTERAIRHGIELVWDRGDIDTLDEFFGNSISNSKGTPTNSEFIARLALLVKREIGGAV